MSKDKYQTKIILGYGAITIGNVNTKVSFEHEIRVDGISQIKLEMPTGETQVLTSTMLIEQSGWHCQQKPAMTRALNRRIKRGDYPEIEHYDSAVYHFAGYDILISFFCKHYDSFLTADFNDKHLEEVMNWLDRNNEKILDVDYKLESFHPEHRLDDLVYVDYEDEHVLCKTPNGKLFETSVPTKMTMCFTVGAPIPEISEQNMMLVRGSEVIQATYRKVE